VLAQPEQAQGVRAVGVEPVQALAEVAGRVQQDGAQVDWQAALAQTARARVAQVQDLPEEGDPMAVVRAAGVAVRQKNPEAQQMFPSLLHRQGLIQ